MENKKHVMIYPYRTRPLLFPVPPIITSRIYAYELPMSCSLIYSGPFS